MSEIISQHLHISDAEGEGARQGYHKWIISFIPIFGLSLTLKYPNESPYDTAYGSVMMDLFIIDICFYLASLAVMAIQAASNNRELADLTNKIGLLLGTLSMILELIILISPFGWIMLFFWSICLLCFLTKSWKALNTLHQSAVGLLSQSFRDISQTLTDWNSRDEANNRESATELQSQNLNISNHRPVTEHQSQDPNHKLVADHAIPMPGLIEIGTT